MKVKLSDYVCNYLIEHDIDHCFTVVGGGAMHLNDSFGHHEKMNCIYNHHEQASAMAAEGYARIAGKPSLLCVTTGPGTTNALTGVLGAYLDSIPMLVISGQVRSDTTVYHNKKLTGYDLRSLGNQEFNIVNTVKTMCKYATMLKSAKDIRYVLDKAIYECQNGRPGPCWIDIPLDLQSAIIETDELKQYIPEEVKYDISDEFIKTIIDEIIQAKRPVLYPGNGIRLSHAFKEFKELIDNLKIPVCTYWDSIDLIETDNPLYTGRAGDMGDRAGNFAVQNADLLLVIGNRLSIRNTGFNYKTWARKAKVIMVDIDEAELYKHTIHVDYPVKCDAKIFINKLNKYIKDNNIEINKKEWINICNNWKHKYPVTDKNKINELNAYYVFDYLSRNLPDDSITVTTNGTCCVTGHQSWFIKDKTRFINNNAVASMGYGLPASIGTCIANNNKEVFCLEGDGSIMMNLQELQTIVTNKLPVKILLINNEGYHSIRQTQNSFFKDHSHIGIGNDSNDLSFPEYKKICDAFDIPYLSIKDKNEITNMIDKFIRYDSYCLLEVFIGKNYIFEPKNSAKQLPDGTIVSPPLEDLAPFLTKEELKENMYIELIDDTD